MIEPAIGGGGNSSVIYISLELYIYLDTSIYFSGHVTVKLWEKAFSCWTRILIVAYRGGFDVFWVSRSLSTTILCVRGSQVGSLIKFLTLQRSLVITL